MREKIMSWAVVAMILIGIPFASMAHRGNLPPPRIWHVSNGFLVTDGVRIQVDAVYRWESVPTRCRLYMKGQDGGDRVAVNATLIGGRAIVDSGEKVMVLDFGCGNLGEVLSKL